jgi:predicted dehydrogenase
VGCRNRNAFQLHGARGMLAFDLEDFNHLVFHDATEAAHLRGGRRLLVTGPDQPYAANFWKPGHSLGYEHTFIVALGEFLGALARGEPFHPDFEDGRRVQRVLKAVADSAQTRQWVAVQ